MPILPALELLHLLGFAAFLGAAVAQRRFMGLSARGGIAPALRDEYERLSASIVTKIELPALFVQVFTGLAMILDEPEVMKQHWLHAKLTAVVLLLVIAHLEMFNARAVVKARAARGDAAADEIAARKKRQALLGVVVAVLVLAVMLLVTVLRSML